MFYGGKGGVGKTTCAAARALVEARAGRRVLAVSTDPAHSLADVFCRTLAARPVPVASRLDAMELDAPRAFARWLDRRRSALVDILEHGTWLDREDAESLLRLTMPGVDELIGLLEITRLGRTGYDLIVVDTAPTGHALRLLAAPATLAAMADVLDALQEPHRIIREQLVRAAGPEAADRVIGEIASDAAAMAASLRDPRAATFVWVTLPERLSITESEDAVRGLSQLGVRIGELVVNRVLVERSSRCPVCERRRAEEQRMLGALRRSLARGCRLRVVPARAEPRGVRALASFGRYLAAGHRQNASARAESSAERMGRRTGILISGEGTFPAESVPAFRVARLIFVGGKGGVGKTTVAAAIALRLAVRRPTQSILLLSTDPAHSLADVLDAPVGDRPHRVARAPSNLRVRELDALHAFRQKRTAIERGLEEIGPDAGAAADAGMARLLELTPPGVDELFGMLSIVAARADYDVIVVDTAPTGHALRLLALPEVARSWVQLVLRLLLKYRAIARPGRLAAELVETSRSIRELQAVLRDRQSTCFVVVTRASALERAETDRLVRDLRAMKMPPAALVINARTLAPRACRRCRTIANAERRNIARMRPPRDCVIIQTPLAMPPPRGAASLARWGQRWDA